MFSADQIRRLLDIANAGCHHGHVLDARSIYEGVLAIKPNFAPALIGLALSHLVVDDFVEAERVLTEEVLAENQDDRDAQALLGLCYVLNQRPEDARRLLTPLTGGSDNATRLAIALLEANSRY